MGVAVHAAQSISAQWTQKTTGRVLPDGPGQRLSKLLFWVRMRAEDRGALVAPPVADTRWTWHYDMSLDMDSYLPPGSTARCWLCSPTVGTPTRGYDPINNNAYWSVAGTGCVVW